LAVSGVVDGGGQLLVLSVDFFACLDFFKSLFATHSARQINFRSPYPATSHYRCLRSRAVVALGKIKHQKEFIILERGRHQPASTQTEEEDGIGLFLISNFSGL
jgi:hypothetical protein